MRANLYLFSEYIDKLPPEWVVFRLGFAHGWLRAGAVTPAHRQIPKRIGRMACPIM